MKSKNKIQLILNLKIFLTLFIFGTSHKVFANEKNFVIATIDRSPITYFDLKQKAKLIHFLRTKNNKYENLNKYFDNRHSANHVWHAPSTGASMTCRLPGIVGLLLAFLGGDAFHTPRISHTSMPESQTESIESPDGHTYGMASHGASE